MRDRDVLEVLQRLERAAISVHVDGGWGIDALVGTQTRTHADLDVAVDQRRLEDAVATLESMGYTYDAAAYPGLPARYVMRDEADRQVDLHLLAIDDDGNGWQKLSDRGAWGCYPRTEWTTGVIAGSRVLCISAELQHRFHLGWEWDAKAWHDMKLLHEQFGTPLPPASPSS